MQTGMGVWRLVETTQPGWAHHGGSHRPWGSIWPLFRVGSCGAWGVSELGNDPPMLEAPWRTNEKR